MTNPVVEAAQFFATFFTLLPQPIRAFIIFSFAAFIACGLLKLFTK